LATYSYSKNREVNGKGRQRIVVGFRTGGHAGTSVPITAEGPSAALFMGYMDQTDIFSRSAQALSHESIGSICRSGAHAASP